MKKDGLEVEVIFGKKLGVEERLGGVRWSRVGKFRSSLEGLSGSLGVSILRSLLEGGSRALK